MSMVEYLPQLGNLQMKINCLEKKTEFRIQETEDPEFRIQETEDRRK